MFLLLGAFKQGAMAGIGGLVLIPLGFLLYAMYLRVVLEVLIVIFRIAEHTAQTAGRNKEPKRVL